MTDTVKKVFVFGSNLAGRHGKGAALHARHYYGAIYGQGEGHQGGAYAIPTKDRKINTMSLKDIKRHIDVFIDYAANNIDLHFFVTRIGCGLAGYSEDEIKPLFKAAPKNCELPSGWRDDA